MIACIIEFGIRHNQEDRRDQLVAELMKAVVTVDGFISKETFLSRDNPEKLITLSYWRDAQSLRGWTRHPAHARTIAEGKKLILSHYSIQVAEVSKNIEWKQPA